MSKNMLRQQSYAKRASEESTEKRKKTFVAKQQTREALSDGAHVFEKHSIEERKILFATYQFN